MHGWCARKSGTGIEAEMADLGHEDAKQPVSIAEPDDPMWTRVNKRETRIAAAMAAEDAPLDRLLDKSFGQMKEGMESALITGISTGQGSSWIAQQMMDAAQIPEQRALLIAGQKSTELTGNPTGNRCAAAGRSAATGACATSLRPVLPA